MSILFSSNADPIVIDVAVLFVAVLSIIVFIVTPFHVDPTVSIPTIVNGLTTATSIMVGISGLLVFRGLGGEAETMSAVRRKLRMALYGAIMVMILQFVGIVYIMLLSGAGVLAFKVSLGVFQASFLVAMAGVFHNARSIRGQ